MAKLAKRPPPKSAEVAKEQEEDGSEPEFAVPDDAKWATLKRYRSFKLPGNDQHFTLEQFVYIRPHPAEVNNTSARKKPRKSLDAEGEAVHRPPAEGELWWIAQIQEIRAEDQANVYMSVRWMYTTLQQLKESGCSRIPKKLVGHEIFMSNFFDKLQVHCVEADPVTYIAPVIRFDEHNPFQEPITVDDIFYRSEMRKPTAEEVAERKAKESVSPKSKKKVARKSDTEAEKPILAPYTAPTCFCRKPYAPVPLEDNPMIFCPRITCRTWYHQKCLEYYPIYRTAANAGRLASLRSSGIDLLTASVAPWSVKSEAPLTPTSTKRGLAVPLEMQRAAESSIMRGTVDAGIVGNASKVLQARVIGLAVDEPRANRAIAAWSDYSMIAIWQDQHGYGEETVTDPRQEVWMCPGCKQPM